jgi:hypothetical protein
MDISIETITPAVARKMLQANTDNRPLTEAFVQRYASDIQAGQWVNDGSPIRFSCSGRLLDGQHRLMAVVASGGQIDAVVIRGLDDDAFETMDTGKPRTAADVLAINGAKNFTCAASIAAAWIYYNAHGHPGSRGGADKARNGDILRVYQETPEIAEAASFHGSRKWIRAHIGAGMFGALYVAACKRGERGTMLQFFNELISPTGLAIGTSVMPLRDRLIEDKASREKMGRAMQGAYLFKAYRDFRDLRTVKQLKVVLNNGRLTKEHFAL